MDSSITMLTKRYELGFYTYSYYGNYIGSKIDASILEYDILFKYNLDIARTYLNVAQIL